MTDQHDQNGGHGGHGEQGTMGVHGMLLFGESPLYLSHLPMFEPPHNFQVILEVAFDDAVSEALRTDRDDGANGIHTYEPAEFHIAELNPVGDGPARSAIEGTIYHGHFERGGQPIVRDAVAEIHRVVYFNELDVESDHRMNQELRYLCFGRARQLHLAHEITASPDFDQVLTARLVPGTVTDPSSRPVAEEVTRDFDTAVQVHFRKRSDTPEDRLEPNETADGFFFATAGPTGSHGFGVQVETGREVYAEMRELGSR